MDLRVDDFRDGGEIPARYTCDGPDERPDVSWSGAPKGTRSYAFSCIDYDVPRDLRPDGTWTHWLVADIPANVHRIRGRDRVPGREIENHFGRGEWGGPCPPDKRHHYVFRVYALSVAKITEELTKESYTEIVESYALAEATVTATYDRPR